MTKDDDSYYYLTRGDIIKLGDEYRNFAGEWVAYAGKQIGQIIVSTLSSIRRKKIINKDELITLINKLEL